MYGGGIGYDTRWPDRVSGEELRPLARILDPDGGHFAIRPDGKFEASRAYVDQTMVLETTLVTASGRAVLTDGMAFGRNERDHKIGTKSQERSCADWLAQPGRWTSKSATPRDPRDGGPGRKSTDTIRVPGWTWSMTLDGCSRPPRSRRAERSLPRRQPPCRKRSAVSATGITATPGCGTPV